MSSQLELQIIGFLLSNTGLGEAARNILRSALCADLKTRCVNIYDGDRSVEMEFLERCGHYNLHISNFIVAPLTSLDSISEAIKKQQYPYKNILYPFWELAKIPENQRKIIEGFDFIYAPSRFIADTFSMFLGKEVPILPLPVVMPIVCPKNVKKDGILRVLALMDLDSCEARKNPHGVVNAFLQAFPVGSTNNVELFLKIRGGHGSELRYLLATILKKDSRIRLVDGVMDKELINKLIIECNIYLSLHRSEGFGFGPAEALAHGKIVIATDYGGTKDFINPQTGFPVKFKLTPVGSQDYFYPENQVWADPDINHAASILDFVYHNYDEACKIAEQGRESLNKTHSVKAVSKLIKDYSVNWQG